MRLHTLAHSARRATTKRMWAGALPLALTLLLLPALAGCMRTCAVTPIYRNSLTSVFAISAGDVWAVGSASAKTGGMAELIEVWDGFHWAVLPNPTIDTGGAASERLPPLLAVAGSSSRDIWAVGEQGTHMPGPVIVHWDGHSLRASSAPCGDQCYASQLNAISALSDTDAWAVGSARNRSESSLSNHTLVERWDGAQWRVAPGSEIISGNGVLNSVVALSATDVWVFGLEGGFAPLIAHWDGKLWNVIANQQNRAALHLPSIAEYSLLSAASVPASASSPSPAIWIVGVASSASDCPKCTNPLILTGSDGRWTRVPPDQLPAEAQGAAQAPLQAIAAVSADDIWIAGAYQSQGEQSNPLSTAYILHWDGKRWVSLPRQQRKTADALTGLSATSPGDIWAVGQSSNFDDPHAKKHGTATLIEHWDGSQWSVIPSPNPGAPLLLGCA